MEKRIAIIEIGSINTKTHVYEGEKLIHENSVTIEFKKNYKKEGKIRQTDLEQLYKVIDHALQYTKNVHVYGCSIFRDMIKEELKTINQKLYQRFQLKIEVVSQEMEAIFSALGCYSNHPYNGNLCILITGGGSIELLFVKQGKVLTTKYYSFGVVDINSQFSDLIEDFPTCTFEEVYQAVEKLVGNIEEKADVLILAGTDHLYWYHHAKYSLEKNTLYEKENQKYMLTRKMSDLYDQNAFITSLDEIRKRSDNPLWFDGIRALKVITNLISHKVHAKYIIPTKINMEEGLKEILK